MQTILGSNGKIGQELAKELYKNYTKDIRLVSRNPELVNESDELFSADLKKYSEAYRSILGSDVVYFVVGLPYSLWDSQFKLILSNVIKACIETGSRLAYFDNTYMYDKNDSNQDENNSFSRIGHKSTIRADMASTLLKAMNDGKINAVIGRSPEFYGPENTQSITNSMIFDRIKLNKRSFIPISDSVLRTLIWTPDASRSLALLGNTPEAYNQTWHLPTDESITYKDLIFKIETITGTSIKYSVIPMWMFRLGSYFNKNIKELMELLPRYKSDNLFNSNKFKQKFPNFKITSFNEGLLDIFKKR